MAGITTRSELLQQLQPAAGSAQRARTLVEGAVDLLGIGSDEILAMQDLLLICEALAREGGAVQRTAEVIAAAALRSEAA